MSLSNFGPIVDTINSCEEESDINDSLEDLEDLFKYIKNAKLEEEVYSINNYTEVNAQQLKS